MAKTISIIIAKRLSLFLRCAFFMWVFVVIAHMGYVFALMFLYGKPRVNYSNQMMQEVQALLVKEEYCESVRKCSGNIFVSGRTEDYDVVIYGISDKRLLASIARIVIKFTAKNSITRKVEIKAYAFSKKEDKYIFFPPIPIRKWQEGTVFETSVEFNNNPSL